MKRIFTAVVFFIALVAIAIQASFCFAQTNEQIFSGLLDQTRGAGGVNAFSSAVINNSHYVPPPPLPPRRYYDYYYYNSPVYCYPEIQSGPTFPDQPKQQIQIFPAQPTVLSASGTAVPAGAYFFLKMYVNGQSQVIKIGIDDSTKMLPSGYILHYNDMVRVKYIPGSGNYNAVSVEKI